ncbi:MAG: LysR family transcriptional regulator [Burkholderiales bacterium]|nr:LysR family transcriptional regulator [Burkholderiales bacterium]
MNFTFRQLQVYAQVIATGSYTRAAEQLDTTQPAVSQQVRQLTEAIGLPLVEQMGRKVYPTEAGRAVLACWETMAASHRELEQAVNGLKGLQRGTLRLAAVSTAEYFVPRFLGPFCARYPGVDVKLEVANRDRVVERLQANADDLYIMSVPPPELELAVHPFLDNPLVAIAPLGHALAARTQLTLADLAGERFILRERGSGTRIAVEEHLARAGVQLDVRLELGSNEAIKEAVAGGLGLAIVSRHTLHRAVEADDVVVLPVEGFPLHTTWQVVHLRRKPLSLLARTFLGELTREAGRYQARKGLEGGVDAVA